MRPYGFTTLLVVLFITIFNSYSKTANKYYLEKVSSVPFSQKRFIIDTLRNGSFIYTLTGTEGSNVVNLYRLGLNNNSIDFLNINVKPANWMFDSEGNWSAVAFTFHPNDSSLYIVSFAQNNFAIQKFGHSSLTFNNVTTLESPVIDQNHTFANSLQYPNIKLGWISSNLEYYLLLALHPHKIPQNDNPFFSLAAFYDNCTWHELLPNPQIINKMVFSFEFECHKCNTITFRLISTDQISYLQYDQGSLAFNEINIVTAPENRKVRGYPVLAKDIDGSTFILYQFSDSQVNEIVIQRISNTDQLGDPKRYLSLAPIYSIRPDSAIQVSGDDVYVALVSQTELLQVYNGSEWADGLRGMSDIVLMRMSRLDLSMKDSLIMSTIGDDNSSRIDIESNGRIILTGITQGNLANPSTGPTLPAGKLFFANILPLAIKGVSTPLISTVPGEILIQPGVPILIEFDSLPSQAFTSPPVVQFGSIPVAQVQWNATKLSIIPPCGLPLGTTDLFVNFSALPYSPIATKSNFNVIKPSIISVKPDAVDTS
ncbi:hypothetical protein BKA69DRAFT_78558 [Paraphysoderma sedebokerense]|nr:hypothetical protein BKA69DRAFT_78558 [Paraphysoderma sedebokerense]